MREPADHTDPLCYRRFIQIPGPNPIVARGGEGEWDQTCIEAGDIFRDYCEGHETYGLYYHGVAEDKTRWPGGYRIGAATAPHPLGPFTKAPQNPLLDLGPEGSWDELHVACPCIIKQGTDRYLMWYSGRGPADDHSWSIGLATASHPLGPWEKSERNPIIEDFGYVGGVVLVEGTYYLYTEYPISSTAQDYGPFALATATDPFGPWVRSEQNPVLAPSGGGGGMTAATRSPRSCTETASSTPSTAASSSTACASARWRASATPSAVMDTTSPGTSTIPWLGARPTPMPRPSPRSSASSSRPSSICTTPCGI